MAAVDTDVYIILQWSPDQKVAAIGAGNNGHAARPFSSERRANAVVKRLEERLASENPDLDLSYIVLPLKASHL